jgi:hypothetical protein
MDSNHKPIHGPRKREDTPKTGNNGENLPYRINGLEQAKTDPGMTPQDIAALDRMIVRLKEKLEAKTEVKREEKEY